MLDSGLPEVVGDSETVIRFLFQSNRFAQGRVKYSAFLPNPEHRNTSVFRIPPDPRLVRDVHTGSALADMELKAAASVLARDVRSAGLHLVSQEPPPRHANIEGWFWDNNDHELTRARNKELAIAIANEALLIELL